MSFKRFVAASTKDAMAQVRRDLGDDAVILSNKRIANGHIEILAAGAQAVEAIVEDARRPQTQAPTGTAQVAVQIAPGVRRIGPPVESFREYLRRQGQNESGPRTTGAGATNTTGPASMYGAVAAAPADDDADEGAWNTGWSDTRFDPSMMPVTRAPAPLAARTVQTGSTGPRSAAPAASHPARAAAPEIDTWLPNHARAVPATPSPATPAPAVFRRRPSRESQDITDTRARDNSTPGPIAPHLARASRFCGRKIPSPALHR
jgi:flagellar biosynthesis GTPase FlhF